MSLFSDAAASALGAARTVFGETVTYRRGASSVELRAARGKTEYDQTYADGRVERVQADDFLIATADLMFAGVAFTPLRMDTIEIVEADGKTRTYQVLSPGDEPEWKYSDAGRTSVRVHTKQISEV